MAVSLADFQDEREGIKRGENQRKCWELQLLKGGVSGFCESEEVKCYDVIYVTGVVGFIITYFHKLIHQLFDNKHRLSSHEKLVFKLTNILCVIQGTCQTGSKTNFPFPIDSCSYFFHNKVLWGPVEGAWLRHSIKCQVPLYNIFCLGANVRWEQTLFFLQSVRETYADYFGVFTQPD